MKDKLTMITASFLTASFLNDVSIFWQKEAVWILFVASGMLITFLKDSLDETKTVTSKKIAWAAIIVIVLCGLLRFYKQEESISNFWFYFWTVMIGVFSPSAVYKILKSSDEKAENAFARIVSAFVDGLVFKINTFFGMPPVNHFDDIKQEKTKENE